MLRNGAQGPRRIAAIEDQGGDLGVAVRAPPAQREDGAVLASRGAVERLETTLGEGHNVEPEDTETARHEVEGRIGHEAGG